MRRGIVIFGCLLLGAGLAIPQVGHFPFGDVSIGMVFADPNGVDHELYVSTEGPWIELMIDDVSVWMDARQARAAAHYLDLAADAATPIEEGERRGRPPKWGE